MSTRRRLCREKAWILLFFLSVLTLGGQARGGGVLFVSVSFHGLKFCWNFCIGSAG